MATPKRTANKIKGSKLLELLESSYIGEVVDIDDPDFVGRCKIKVYGVFGDKNESLGKIPTADLPWAYPHLGIVFGSGNGSGVFSTPKMGAKIRVIFEGDLYHPRYFAIEELDNELQELIKADYKNFHSLVYDSVEQLKMYYAKNTGFLIELKGSTMNIEPGGAIVINHKDSTATIDIRGNDIDIVTKNAVNISTPNTITHNSNMVHVNGSQTRIGSNDIFSAVNGENLFLFLQLFSAAHDAKTPNTPGQMASILESMRLNILSQTVTTSP